MSLEPAVLQLIDDLRRLAQERHAVILAHYYCRPELQRAADVVGDSLGLSQAAADSQAEVIVFAGAHFMAETASLLCPDKIVVLAHGEAGCPMADMVDAAALARRRQQLPEAQVLTYVNSPAAVKALSDICCTSANAAAVLRSLDSRPVLMTPDRNLAAYVQSLCPERQVIAWDGYCPVHDSFSLQQLRQLKAAHPQALVAAHPECRPQVLAEADFIGSTSAIIQWAVQSPEREFIIATEEGVAYQLSQRCPDKIFHFPEGFICHDMKKARLSDLKRALETLQPRVSVREDIRRRALPAIEKMLAIKP